MRESERKYGGERERGREDERQTVQGRVRGGMSVRERGRKSEIKYERQRERGGRVRVCV
jgi:hypothetical protein